MIANLPRFMKRNRTAPIHFSPRDAHGTTSGTPTCTRAAGTSAPTTHRATSVNVRYARTRTPCAHLVGRDVLGAPRPRDDIGNAHVYAGRRGRRPLPRSTPHPHGRARRPRRAAPTGRHRERPRARGPPGRRPLPRSAPCPHTRAARRTRTPRPHTHAMRTPGPARRPRRDVAHGTPTGTPTGARAAGTSAPTTHRATSANARRTHTPCAAHVRHARTW